MIFFLVQQAPSLQQTAQQREFLRQQEEYRRQQEQAADAHRQNQMVQQQLQQEQDRLAREREQLELQRQQIARQQQQRPPPDVSVKDTVRGILESSKFGNDFGFERPKSAGSRVTEARMFCCVVYPLSFPLYYIGHRKPNPTLFSLLEIKHSYIKYDISRVDQFYEFIKIAFPNIELYVHCSTFNV